MARRSIRVIGLDVLARRLNQLGNEAPDQVQSAIDDVADRTLDQMHAPFHQAIVGGPAEFTKIKPGSKKSAVVPSRRKRGASKGVAESLISVQDKQSGFLRFHLDDKRGKKDNDRRPGRSASPKSRTSSPTPRS